MHILISNSTVYLNRYRFVMAIRHLYVMYIDDHGIFQSLKYFVFTFHRNTFIRYVDVFSHYNNRLNRTQSTVCTRKASFVIVYGHKEFCFETLLNH